MHKPLVNHVLFRPKASRHRGDFFKRAITCFALRKMKIFSFGKGFVYKRIVREQTGEERENSFEGKHLSSGKESGTRMSGRKERRERKKKEKERGERRKVSEGSFVSLLDLMPS